MIDLDKINFYGKSTLWGVLMTHFFLFSGFLLQPTKF